MKGLLLDSEALLSTALPPSGGEPYLGGGHRRRWQDLQDRCLRVPVSVVGAHVGGGSGLGVAPEGSSRWKLPPSPVPTPCPVLSCPLSLSVPSCLSIPGLAQNINLSR